MVRHGEDVRAGAIGHSWLSSRCSVVQGLLLDERAIDGGVV